MDTLTSIRPVCPVSHERDGLFIEDRMKSVLDVRVSCFANYLAADNPKPVNLLLWLSSNKHVYKQAAIQHLGNKKEIDKYKATLPAITVSGEFTHRATSGLIRHSGLICLDIDFKGNERIRNYTDLKRELSKITNVAYCGFSVSGTGLFIIIPIAYPEQHESQFKALRELFENRFKIEIDAKCKDVSRLRGYAFDADGYFNHQATPFTGLYTDTPKPLKSENRPSLYTKVTTGYDVAQQVEDLIGLIEELQKDVTKDYNDWLKIGFALANEFGESGRYFMHRISQFYTGYDRETTDGQFNRCLKTENIRTQIGTLFYICKAHGLELFKQELPNSIRKQSECQLSPKVPFEKNKIKHLTVELCGYYPPEWDEPNLPNAVPRIRFLNQFEIKQKYPTLSK